MKLKSVMGEFVSNQLKDADYILLNKKEIVEKTVLKKIIADLKSAHHTGKVISVSAKTERKELKEVCELLIT